MSSVKPGPAVVVGSGPNGLSAAITLAQAGIKVTVYEKNEVIGGACRSIELIRPGYIHDIGSAVHPLAVASPFFRNLPLKEYGLEWIQPKASLAHPFDDGTAIIVNSSISETASLIDGPDVKHYQKLMEPLVSHWKELLDEVIQLPRFSVRHPMLLSRFGQLALFSAAGFAEHFFSGPRARALFGGLGVHSVMNLEKYGSIAAGLILGTAAHAVGWPLPKGGSQRITDALAGYLVELGGNVITGSEVKSLDQLPPHQLIMLDITPRQFLDIAAEHIPDSYKQKMRNYRYGPGVYKVDWILDGPVPWSARECHGAGTVHIGGYLNEIVASEKDAFEGRHAEKPFTILVQPSLFDTTRSKDTGHIVWGYCHVPMGSSFDMTERIESQIERFAPGFKEKIIARHSMDTTDIQKDNPNCIHGDITGGSQSLKRVIFPEISYNTPIDNVFLCSSTTPPGPGVHGMCGLHAAQLALQKLKLA